MFYINVLCRCFMSMFYVNVLCQYFMSMFYVHQTFSYVVVSIRQISALSQFYPGRASSTPTMDLFITLLQMGMHIHVVFIHAPVLSGRQGYDNLRISRKELFEHLKCRLLEISTKFPIRVIHTPANGVSIAIDISFISSPETLGSSLYLRRYSFYTSHLFSSILIYSHLFSSVLICLLF